MTFDMNLTLARDQPLLLDREELRILKELSKLDHLSKAR